MRAHFSKGLAGPNTVALLLTIGLLGSLVFGMVTIDSQNRQIAQLSSNSDALREQVKDAGDKPVAPPAKSVTGDAGKDGQIGPRGFTGDEGPRGDIGVAGLLGAVGPVGSNGLNGLDGMTGATGADGADGAPGADGATGPKGDTGAAGADGEPAASYTIAGPGGEQTCTRTEPFDKAAPTYECALTPKEIP